MDAVASTLSCSTVITGFACSLARLPLAWADRYARSPGDTAVVIGDVAPLVSLPAIPWPLRSIPGWRSTALQAAADRLTGRPPILGVERFSGPLRPDPFAALPFGMRKPLLALPLVA
jgi:hypothetical protein